MIKATCLFVLWWILSAASMIFCKRALDLAPTIAFTTSCLQMSWGMLYVCLLWLNGYRERPEPTKSDIKCLLPVACLQSLVHVGVVVSMANGTISYTMIVKLAEPAVSACVTLLQGSKLPVTIVLTILLTIGGIIVASIAEVTFRWTSFLYAMVANVASSGRRIVGEMAMNESVGHDLSPINLFAVLNLLSIFFLVPLALVMEGPVLPSAMAEMMTTGQLLPYLCETCLASICFYLYNEIGLLILDDYTPIMDAIGNTLRGVFIVLSSMWVFGNRMTPLGIGGSTLAFSGVLLYAMERIRIANKNMSK